MVWKVSSVFTMTKMLLGPFVFQVLGHTAWN